ncbi:hypothetical protein [Streptomyces sp. CRN 30]|uniref:hypothetical protein n=1 Tax=Streptomyces sp. CRN 30 TaxID=3075613 RepID=UPI002A7EF849|nr:hypothetical protein [Streptomyces sp. CRN 30]
MSLVELIAQADERGLTAAGLACLDRCVPLLGGDDEVLRPLWVSLVEDGEHWNERVAGVREELGSAATDDLGAGSDGGPATDEATALARHMLATVPAERSAGALREWAGACSLAALRIHRLLDGAVERAGGPPSPLVAAELRRQTAVLELLAGHGAAGVRQALDVSTEGRRVLRAVVSRRTRTRA